MAATYTLISVNYLSSASNTVSFTSIPTTYTDLRLSCCMKNAGGAYLRMLFNSNSYGNTLGYSKIQLQGGGTSVGWSGSGTQFDVTDINCEANLSWNYTIDIMGCNNTNTNFSWFGRGGVVVGGTTQKYLLTNGAVTGTSTTTLTSIDLTAQGTAFSAGSRFQLFGITRA